MDKQVPKPDTNAPVESWQAYWKAEGQSWRTEVEIDAKRQMELAQYCTILPDIKQNTYPFKGVKLSRADIEWLLATHKSKGIRAAIERNDDSFEKYEGLDLRAADLRGEDLSGLPLVNVQGGLLQGTDWKKATVEQREIAAVHLEGANLRGANLQGAILNNAHLEGADLRAAHLEGATLSYTHLEGKIVAVDNQRQVRKSVTKVLPPANLREVFFDSTTHLELPTIGDKQSGFISLADVRWEGTNLAVIDWSQVNMLGDESRARQQKSLSDYFAAVRANRQLALVLRDQGLNEEADRFAYRAQRLQRVVFRRQRKYGRYLFSGFLHALAGYGYNPLLTLGWYILVVSVFACAYYQIWVNYHIDLLTKPPSPLSWIGAIILSITAFHGRGFFLGGNFGYNNLITFLAALEAIIGLIIEFSFIATFTQRFFAK